MEELNVNIQQCVTIGNYLSGGLKNIIKEDNNLDCCEKMSVDNDNCGHANTPLKIILKCETIKTEDIFVEKNGIQQDSHKTQSIDVMNVETDLLNITNVKKEHDDDMCVIVDQRVTRNKMPSILHTETQHGLIYLPCIV